MTQLTHPSSKYGPCAKKSRGWTSIVRGDLTLPERIREDVPEECPLNSMKNGE